MGLLDFLFAGAVIKSVKKARYNSSQATTHGHVSDYDHGYHDNYDCHDTFDCGGYDDDCENDCNW